MRLALYNTKTGEEKPIREGRQIRVYLDDDEERHIELFLSDNQLGKLFIRGSNGLISILPGSSNSVSVRLRKL